MTLWHPNPHRIRLWLLLALLGALVVAMVGFGGAPQGPAPAAEPEPQSVGPVANLAASAEGQDAGAVRLTWTAAENAQVHFIAYLKSSERAAGDMSVARVAAFDGTETEGVISGLEPGTAYDFTAIGMRWNWANYRTIWGGWSRWVSATPPAGSAARSSTTT